MVVKRKISSQASDLEKKRSEIIDAGGYVVADTQKEAKKFHYFPLRMPVKMIGEIDKAMSDTVGISKTGWILQAIQEKIRQS